MPLTSIRVIASRAQACRRPARGAGVGMIEVLVALIVLSVGMLAVIGMQITGKQAYADSVLRTSAAHLSSDLIERMRVNSNGLSAYLSSSVLGGTSLSAPSNACDSSTSPCTQAQLAARDLYAWERALDGAEESRQVSGNTRETGGLVNARACVTGPSSGGSGLYELIIVWRGKQEQSTANLGTSVCGGGLDSTGLYGSANRYRRILRVSFFIGV